MDMHRWSAEADGHYTSTFVFQTNISPEIRADELLETMWEEDLVGIDNENTKFLTPDDATALIKTDKSI